MSNKRKLPTELESKPKYRVPSLFDLTLQATAQHYRQLQSEVMHGTAPPEELLLFLGNLTTQAPPLVSQVLRCDYDTARKSDCQAQLNLLTRIFDYMADGGCTSSIEVVCENCDQIWDEDLDWDWEQEEKEWKEVLEDEWNKIKD